MTPSIVLVQPPLVVSVDVIDYPYHSDLGVVQAAAVLRAAGADVRVIDAFAEAGGVASRLSDDRILLGCAPRDLALGSVADDAVLVVHYTPFHRPPSRDPTLAELLERLRAEAPRTPIVLADLYQSGEHYIDVGGAAVVVAYPEVDAYLQYEAEAALPGLCDELSRGGRPDAPLVRAGGEDVDLDAQPLPAWDLVDLEARDRFMVAAIDAFWRGHWAFPIDGRTLPAITSRGCPYRCAHCSSNPGRGEGEPKRQRRPRRERVEALVAALVRDHGASRIDVLDEMVNVDTGHFDALLGALVDSDVRFDFPNGMRADWVTAEQLQSMAGRITTLSVSAESGVQRVVDRVVDKRLDLSAIERTVARAAELGIPTLVHFIIGMPGETRTEINETLEYAVRLNQQYGAWPGVQFATPLPGTRLEREAVETGGPLPEIDDFGPLFQHRPVTRGEDFTPEDLRLFKWTFDQRIAAGHQPTKVIMNVTYRCNNHCGFCAVGNRSTQDGRFEDQRALLLEYRRRGIRLVDFDGGEPTLYAKLVPLIRYAREIDYDAINVTTNGRMAAYDVFAKRLVQSGLSSLLFSLHGVDAETHGRNVGVNEAFDQTVAGIRNCVRHAPEGVDLGMNITVTRSNQDDLPAYAQLAWDLGIRWLNIQFLTPFGRATREVCPDEEKAAALTMQVIDTWRDRMKLQVVNLPFCLLPGYEDFVLGDLLKIQRQMVFVNNEDVNLYDYLRDRRAYAEQCHGCPHKVFCGGFYELDDVPEPPWEFSFRDVGGGDDG